MSDLIDLKKKKYIVDGIETDSVQGARKLLKTLRKEKRLGRTKTVNNIKVNIKPLNEEKAKELALRTTLKRVQFDDNPKSISTIKRKKKKIQFSDQNSMNFKDIKDKFNTQKPGEEEVGNEEGEGDEEYEALKKEFADYRETSTNELNEHIKA